MKYRKSREVFIPGHALRRHTETGKGSRFSVICTKAKAIRQLIVDVTICLFIICLALAVVSKMIHLRRSIVVGFETNPAEGVFGYTGSIAARTLVDKVKETAKSGQIEGTMALPRDYPISLPTESGLVVQGVSVDAALQFLADSLFGTRRISGGMEWRGDSGSLTIRFPDEDAITVPFNRDSIGAVMAQAALYVVRWLEPCCFVRYMVYKKALVLTPELIEHLNGELVKPNEIKDINQQTLRAVIANMEKTQYREFQNAESLEQCAFPNKSGVNSAKFFNTLYTANLLALTQEIADSAMTLGEKAAANALRGEVLVALGKVEEAKGVLSGFTDEYQGYAKEWYALSAGLLTQERFKEAIVAEIRAIALDGTLKQRLRYDQDGNLLSSGTGASIQPTIAE